MNIEEFVNDYLQEHRHEVLLSPYNGLVEFAEALKVEALKEAVEVENVVEEGRYCQEIGPIFLDERAGFKPGDKVRIIVLPKED